MRTRPLIDYLREALQRIVEESNEPRIRNEAASLVRYLGAIADLEAAMGAKPT